MGRFDSCVVEMEDLRMGNGSECWVRLCGVLLYCQLVSWFLAASTQPWGSDGEKAM